MTDMKAFDNDSLEFSLCARGRHGLEEKASSLTG
jgi:hypothetical protein